MDHHHHDDEVCTIVGDHMHAEGHGHFSCDICLFHFAPTDDFQAEDLSVQLPDIIFIKSYFTYHNSYFAQEIQQSFLRGPPEVNA